MTMTEMKRRAGAMVDFISRTQVEMAAESKVHTNGLAKPSTTSSTTAVVDESAADGQNSDFRDLSVEEMMGTLTRNLVHWQKEYGTLKEG